MICPAHGEYVTNSPGKNCPRCEHDSVISGVFSSSSPFANQFIPPPGLPARDKLPENRKNPRRAIDDALSAIDRAVDALELDEDTATASEAIREARRILDDYRGG